MNRLKELREERGLSIRQMEIKTGINHASVSLYELEKREPNIATLKKLSKFFGTTIDYILCNDTYCVFAIYKEGNYMFTIREQYYKELKEKKYIYFDNNDDRCIDINSLVGVGKTNDIMGFIQEMTRIDKLESLFEKKNIKQEDFDALDEDFEKIELTRGLVERIKDAIR